EANEDPPFFTINGQVFSKEKALLTPRLDTAEEWTLSSINQEVHPFHIHVNPFEVIERDGAGRIKDRYWRDTIVLAATNDEKNPVTVRTRFRNFTGKTVLH